MSIFKRLISIVAVLAFSVSLGLATTSTVSAARNDQVCEGINLITGENGDCGASEDVTDGLSSTVNNLINLFSLIVGAVSVVMVIFGGFKYMTSQGSDEGTKSAKNTILYALIGLVIVLLAQTIVKYVFSKATEVGTSA